LWGRPGSALVSGKVFRIDDCDMLPMVSLSAHSEALSHWARWAARLQLGEAQQSEPGTRESLRTPDWNALRRLISARALITADVSFSLPQWLAASEFIQNCMAMSQAEGARLAQLYKDSKLRLFPLSDPLNVLFPLHRQLSSSREEVYSDWFQWVLLQIADARLIGWILGSPNAERFANSQEPIRVDREIPVEHGHIDQTGRLDLVISQGSARIAAIEVKTRAYSEADLEKHKGYSDSIISPETELIFLSVDLPDSDLSGFRFRSWADVCVTLRAIAPRLLGPERILGTALILAFVGAVEQNLLGFVSPETTPMPIGKVPRMVDHLTIAAQTEVEIGNP
jgi:hypothetical protein